MSVCVFDSIARKENNTTQLTLIIHLIAHSTKLRAQSLGQTPVVGRGLKGFQGPSILGQSSGPFPEPGGGHENPALAYGAVAFLKLMQASLLHPILWT